MPDEDTKVKLFDGLLCAYNISSDTIRAWGEATQLDKVVEECAELIVAIQHSRSRTLDTRIVASEIADVLVMVICAARIVGADAVSEEMNRKLVRLRGRLETIKPKVDLEDKYRQAMQRGSELESMYRQESMKVDQLREQIRLLQENLQPDNAVESEAPKSDKKSKLGTKTRKPKRAT
jgi:NTP pyrophosphatase (non-canonical NTP hydrolase)